MEIRSFYPVVMTQDVAATTAFFVDHFDFKPLFSSDWYVHLQASDDPAVNLAVLDGSHLTIPAAGRGTASGVLLNFEVEDVDAHYARLEAAGLPVLLGLRDEDFGQRHFIVQGPEGILVDIITPIAPTEEFATQYDPSALVPDSKQ